MRRNTAAFSTNHWRPARTRYKLQNRVVCNRCKHIMVTQLPQTSPTPNQWRLRQFTNPWLVGQQLIHLLEPMQPARASFKSTTPTTLTLNKVPGRIHTPLPHRRAGSGSVTQTVSITIGRAATPSITPSDPCQTQVILRSQLQQQLIRINGIETVLLTLRWGQQVTLTSADDGDQFQVELLSAASVVPIINASH